MASKVLWHVTMSVDGFIAGPDDAMDWALQYPSEPNPAVEEVIQTTGAILAGRRWYDVATSRYGGRAGIYGGAWTGPVFVLTHRLDHDVSDPGITLLSATSPRPWPPPWPPPGAGTSASSAPASPSSAWPWACSTSCSSISPPSCWATASGCTERHWRRPGSVTWSPGRCPLRDGPTPRRFGGG